MHIHKFYIYSRALKTMRRSLLIDSTCKSLENSINKIKSNSPFAIIKATAALKSSLSRETTPKTKTTENATER